MPDFIVPDFVVPDFIMRLGTVLVLSGTVSACMVIHLCIEH